MSEEADGFGIYMEEACDSLSGIWAAFRLLAIQNHMPQGSMSMPNLDAQILENDRLLPLSFSVQKAVAIPIIPLSFIENSGSSLKLFLSKETICFFTDCPMKKIPAEKR